MPQDIEIRGLNELLRKLSPDLISRPLGNFLKRTAIQIQGEGRRRTMSDWHDTGQTANAIAYEVDSANPPLWARAGWLNASPGSPLWFKARAGEFGTGRQGDPEVSHLSGHWPPGEALGTWAARHGMASGYQVARAIGMRGGIRPRKPLRSGLEASLSAIRGFLDRLGDEIRERWEH